MPPPRGSLRSFTCLAHGSLVASTGGPAGIVAPTAPRGRRGGSVVLKKNKSVSVYYSFLKENTIYYIYFLFFSAMICMGECC